MTATTSNLDARPGARIHTRIRRLALVAGSLMAAMGTRWSDFVDSGQLGPTTQQPISRHTGART